MLKIASIMLVMLPLSAGAQPRPEAEATQERRLQHFARLNTPA